MGVQQRLSFIERGFIDGSIISKVLDFDSSTLRVENTGLHLDLVQVLGRFFDVSDLEDIDMANFSYLQDLRDQLVLQLDEAHFLEFAQSTGRNFWSNLAEDAFLPRGFGDAMGSVDYERARVIILFWGMSFASVWGRRAVSALFVQLSFMRSSHFFLCPNAPYIRTGAPELARFPSGV